MSWLHDPATLREVSPNLPRALPLRDQLHRRLRAAGPGLALRVRDTPAGPRRALLHGLLEDAAARGGGDTVDRGCGDLLLIGAAPALAHQVADRIDAIGALPPVERHELPAAIETLLDWAAAAAAPASPPRPADPAPLDDRLGAVPPARLLRLRSVFRRDSGPPRPVAQRLAVDRAALAAALGDLAHDPELAAHAADRLMAWAMAQADPAAFGADQTLPVLLPLPLRGEPTTPGQGLRVALLPLAGAADPPALAAKRSRLATLGWGLALGPIEAAAMALLEPGALAADLLLLRWSDGWESRAVAGCLRPLDPRALVLGGCDTPAALDWGRALGIRRFAGPAAAR